MCHNYHIKGFILSSWICIVNLNFFHITRIHVPILSHTNAPRLITAKLFASNDGGNEPPWTIAGRPMQLSHQSRASESHGQCRGRSFKSTATLFLEDLHSSKPFEAISPEMSEYCRKFRLPNVHTMKNTLPLQN